MIAEGNVLIREARETDIPGIARVHVDAWRETYRGLVPDDYLDSLSYEKRGEMWKRVLSSSGDRADFVAVDPEMGIVGFASASGDPENILGKPAELHAIYILRSHQFMGIGRRLISAVAERLVSKGYAMLVLWVLKDNPSRAFYESLGGELLSSKGIDIGSVTLTEVQYGWPDLATLIKQDS